MPSCKYYTKPLWTTEMSNHRCVKFRFSGPKSRSWVSRTWESAFSTCALDNSDESGLWTTFEEHLLIITLMCFNFRFHDVLRLSTNRSLTSLLSLLYNYFPNNLHLSCSRLRPFLCNLSLTPFSSFFLASTSHPCWSSSWWNHSPFFSNPLVFCLPPPALWRYNWQHILFNS